jgi:hypothetical protein
LRYICQPDSSGFPEGFPDQRFLALGSGELISNSALQRAYLGGFSIREILSPLAGSDIVGYRGPGRKKK